MALVGNSKGLSQLFKDDGSVSLEVLAKRLGDRKFSLVWPTNGNEHALQLLDNGSNSMDQQEELAMEDHTLVKELEDSKRIRPVELNLISGSALILLICGGACVLVVLYTNAIRNDGNFDPNI
jgi:hypothetical protein